MRTIESIRKVYDKYSCYIAGPFSSCVVDEHEKGATFRHLNISTLSPSMYLCKTDFIAGMKDVTETRSSHLHDSNCDGTLFIYDAKDTEHVVFVELKSSFSASQIEHAFKQLVFSYYKYHCLASVCDGYNLSCSLIDFVLACKALDKDVESEMYDDILMNQELNENCDVLTFSKDLLPRLLNASNREIKFCLSNLRIGHNQHLAEELVNKEIILHLITASNQSDDFANVTLY